MASVIERPRFYEGQILSAIDLETGVEYARKQRARHDRTLHRWGIAEGLVLSAEPRSLAQGAGSVDYVEVTLGAGLAIDGTGREVVVAEQATLSATDFDRANVAIDREDAWYPVFLVGKDQTGSVERRFAGACGSTQPNRIDDAYEVAFGRPGAALGLVQPTPAVAEGPGGATGSTPFLILLGFLQWNRDIKRFSCVSDSQDGVSRRYVGVRAEAVESPSGKLTLRSAPEMESDKPTLLLATDADGKGELSFGLSDAQGGISRVFRVTAQGDLELQGTIKAALTEGEVKIESGVVTHGALVPLPEGVDPQQVAAGQVRVHIRVTPRVPGSLPPETNPDDWAAFAYRCTVSTERRVNCVYRWLRVAGGAGQQFSTGACDYTVIAVVPAQGGSA